MIWFAIPPLVIRFRKKRAKKKGVEYKPLFPKTKEKVDRIKCLIKNKKNEKVI